jgi:hypothetical protein
VETVSAGHFTLARDSRVFVLCPPAIATGGPESLHLFVHQLRRQGHDARIVYLPPHAQPIHDDYAGYDVVTAPAIEDRAGNVVVVPEIWSNVALRVSAAQRAIWWLSVDNYLAHAPFELATPGITHLSGSAYATAFLRARGVTHVTPLSTPVHDCFAAATTRAREALVVYNPRKGLPLVERLIAAAPRLTWRPIVDLPRAGVVDLLQRAKVYVDFGPHPGKERLPREAALAGCCVITGMQGSAAFFDDVAIPDAYKLDDRGGVSDAMLQRIVTTIADCIDEHETRQREFADYRRRILGERAFFESALAMLFPRVS